MVSGSLPKKILKILWGHVREPTPTVHKSRSTNYRAGASTRGGATVQDEPQVDPSPVDCSTDRVVWPMGAAPSRRLFLHN